MGKSAAARLNGLGIHTIGDLAKADPEMIRAHLKKHGEVIWNYAWGREEEDERRRRKGTRSTETASQRL